MLCLTGLAVAIVTLSDVRTPTLVIDVDAIASDRSLEQLVSDVLTCAPCRAIIRTASCALRHRAARSGAHVRHACDT